MKRLSEQISIAPVWGRLTDANKKEWIEAARKLEADNEKMKAVLRWYGSSHNHPITLPHHGCSGFNVCMDAGQRARTVLESLEVKGPVLSEKTSNYPETYGEVSEGGQQ